MGYLTPNFMLEEFLSHHDQIKPDASHIANLNRLANRLQAVRDIIKKPIIITSGFRSKPYQMKINPSAPNSYHTLGMACDIVIPGMSPASVQEFLSDWSGGMGSYSTHTHLDIRNDKARWT